MSLEMVGASDLGFALKNDLEEGGGDPQKRLLSYTVP
jgi:hypothetical protein